MGAEYHFATFPVATRAEAVTQASAWICDPDRERGRHASWGDKLRFTDGPSATTENEARRKADAILDGPRGRAYGTYLLGEITRSAVQVPNTYLVHPSATHTAQPAPFWSMHSDLISGHVVVDADERHPVAVLTDTVGHQIGVSQLVPPAERDRAVALFKASHLAATRWNDNQRELGNILGGATRWIEDPLRTQVVEVTPERAARIAALSEQVQPRLRELVEHRTALQRFADEVVAHELARLPKTVEHMWYCATIVHC